jgi:SnoaL-like domain
MPYAEALAAARLQHPTPFAAGSDHEKEAIARFGRFFADFSPAKIEQLLDVTYAERLYFNDTLKEIAERASLRHYLAESAAAIEACRVEIDEVIANGQGDYYFRWRMMIRFRRFARGRDTWSIGISQIRFDADGRVVFHQDFWNAADGLFQYVPLLGGLIRWIKRRL